MMHGLLLQLCWLVLGSAVALPTAVITSIQPRHGGYMGGKYRSSCCWIRSIAISVCVSLLGQLITIAGIGFERQGNDGETRVFIGSNDCKVG